MERLSKTQLEKLSKERCSELIKRSDSRELLNSLVYARVILESDLNPRDIYYSELIDGKDSLMGCLIVLPISRNREDLAQKLEKRFSWMSSFSKLQREDYQDIVDMSLDISTFMSDWQEEE